MIRPVPVALAFILCPSVLHAAIVLPTTDTSDGILNPTATNTVIDLSLAASATWSAPNPTPGLGVYDGAKWAVVFKYSSVNIAAGRTVTFTNHPTRAPVVWLVNGNVTIHGTVNLNGQNLVNSDNSEPGPGGFRGGIPKVNDALIAGGGLGPGGGGIPASLSPAGSHATLGELADTGATYGSPQLLPLIGGSGGSGSTTYVHSGGAGGGAILIAATGSITVNGTVSANGGIGNQGGSGSGGAIRLVADTVTGTGSLQASGGASTSTGGQGRIRVEANSVGAGLSSIPSTSASTPGSPVLIWPPDTTPVVRVISVGGQAVPTDPRASLGPAPADVLLDSIAPVTATIQTTNVSTTARVTVRVVPKHGTPTRVPATFVNGNEAQATWTAQVTLPQGSCAIQARVDPS